jgi:peptidoglycan/xylan/chitin deacetylase (PgdA/CDA1 family)
MNSKIFLKTLYATVLYHAGAMRALRAFQRDRNIILGYHRVLNEHAPELEYLQPGMYVTSKTFERHMEYLSRSYKLYDLAEVSSFSDVQGACFVTFDDGWSDTYENAFPVLRRHGVPATIFVSTDLVGSREMLWSDRMSVYSRYASADQVKGIVRILLGDSGNSDQGALTAAANRPDRSAFREAAIGHMKRLSDESFNRVMGLLDQYMGGTESYLPGKKVWLTWEEISDRASKGISFGSHAHHHKILTNMDDNEIIKEISCSRETFSAKLGMEVDLFSYPNGNYNERIISVLKSSAFRFGFTTEPGFVSGTDHPLALGRVLIHEDVTSTIPMFAGKLTRCLP